jgi:transcription initiation factor TFIID subunit TAF12
MSTPPPVDLNKLKGILGNAKKVMNKVETGDFESGNVDGGALTEEGVQQLQSEGVTRPATNAQPQEVSKDRITNSGLPDDIKKLMLENPIPKLSGPSHTFSLDDVSDLTEEKPMGIPQTPKTNQRPIQENVVNQNNGMINVSENVLRAMIKDVLIEYLTTDYTKNLTENVIKKTVNTLIKEGKINVKKKTRA